MTLRLVYGVGRLYASTTVMRHPAGGPFTQKPCLTPPPPVPLSPAIKLRLFLTTMSSPRHHQPQVEVLLWPVYDWIIRRVAPGAVYEVDMSAEARQSTLNKVRGTTGALAGACVARVC